MKKQNTWLTTGLKVVLVCAVMAGTMEAKAQTLKYGVKAGMNFSKLSFEKHDYDIHDKMGFFVGPTVKLSLPVAGLGLDAAALYDQRQGEALAEIDGGRIYWTTLKRHHLVVPVNVRYDVGSKIFGAFVFAGPQISFNVGSSEPTNMDYGDWEPRSVVFGMNVGLGVTIISHLQLSVNYNLVFNKDADIAINRDNADFRYVDTAKMNAWQLSLSYYF